MESHYIRDLCNKIGDERTWHHRAIEHRTRDWLVVHPFCAVCSMCPSCPTCPMCSIVAAAHNALMLRTVLVDLLCN